MCEGVGVWGCVWGCVCVCEGVGVCGCVCGVCVWVCVWCVGVCGCEGVCGYSEEVRTGAVQLKQLATDYSQQKHMTWADNYCSIKG